MRRGWKRALAVIGTAGLFGAAGVGPAQAAENGTRVWGAVLCDTGTLMLPVAARKVIVTTDLGTVVGLTPDPVWGTFNTRLPISWLGGTRLHLDVECDEPLYGRYGYDVDTGLVFPGGGWPVWVGSYYAAPPQ